MPSGAKKRKSARRKKGEEMEQQQGLVPPPDSTTDAAADNTHDGKENTSSSSSSSDEEEQEQTKEPGVRLETQEAVEMDPVVEKVEDMEIPVSTEAEAVSVEFIQAEKSEVGVEAAAEAVAVASSVPTDAPVRLDEETIEPADGAAGTLETLLEVDSLSHEVEVKPAPNLALEETPVATAELPRDSGELQHDTETTSERTLAALPASWWNCCGLRDVLTGS